MHGLQDTIVRELASSSGQGAVCCDDSPRRDEDIPAADHSFAFEQARFNSHNNIQSAGSLWHSNPLPSTSKLQGARQPGALI